MKKSQNSRETILDEAILRSYFPSNLKAKTDFLNLFNDCLTKGFTALDGAIQHEDWSQIQFLAHRLRGSTAAIGAHRLSRLLQRLEVWNHLLEDFPVSSLFDEAVSAKADLLNVLRL